MKPLLTLIAATLFFAQTTVALAENPKVKMETSMGEVTIELYPEQAPRSVANFLGYVNDGSYDGTIFHRVIKNFMNQGGGYDKDYTKRSTGMPIPNEAFNGLKNERGTVAMARTNAPHSATNQFFINTADNAFLDHTEKSMRGWGYAVFGRVVSGMEVMDKIADTKTGSSGPFQQDAPLEQVVIVKVSEIKAAAETQQ